MAHPPSLYVRGREVTPFSPPCPCVCLDRHEDHGHPAVQLLDATEAKGGLYLPSTTVKGACENTQIKGLCGELAFYGLACETQVSRCHARSPYLLT